MTIGPELSDLFFNHQNANIETYYADVDEERPGSEEELCKAVLADATEFVDMYKRTANGTTAEELADDYMGRI